MRHAFSKSPDIGRKVVVRNAGNMYIGVVRRTSLSPYKSITLTDAYDKKKNAVMNEIPLMEADPTDQWGYLSEESPAIQAKIEEIYAAHYTSIMEYIHEHPGMSPLIRKDMLRSVPSKIKEPYQMEAKLNKVSKHAVEKFGIPPELVYQIIGKTPTKRPTKRPTHAGTRRAKKKCKFFGF